MPVARMAIFYLHYGRALDIPPRMKAFHFGAAAKMTQGLLYVFEVAAVRLAAVFFYVQPQRVKGFLCVFVGYIGGHGDGSDTTIVAFSLMLMQGQVHFI